MIFGYEYIFVAIMDIYTNTAYGANLFMDIHNLIIHVHICQHHLQYTYEYL